MASYIVAFGAEAVRKILLSEHQTSMSDFSKKIGVSLPTLRQWIKRHHDVTSINSQLSEAVLRTLNIAADKRSAYCRQKGILPEELEEWELDMKHSLTKPRVDESEYLKLKKEKEALKNN